MSNEEDILNLLAAFAQRAGGKLERFESRDAAATALKNFLAEQKANNKNFKVGDLVERNEYGLKRYAMPRPQEAAIVVQLLAEPKFGDDFEDMIIGVAIGKGTFGFYSVNSAYYQPAIAKASYSFAREDRKDGPKFDA